jgi:hypothetical protein
VHRRSTTWLESLTNTAILDEPAPLPSREVNAKSSKVTPALSPETFSEKPLGGALLATLLASYAHVPGDEVQSSPP